MLEMASAQMIVTVPDAGLSNAARCVFAQASDPLLVTNFGLAKVSVAVIMKPT